MSMAGRPKVVLLDPHSGPNRAPEQHSSAQMTIEAGLMEATTTLTCSGLSLMKARSVWGGAGLAASCVPKSAADPALPKT